MHFYHFLHDGRRRRNIGGKEEGKLQMIQITKNSPLSKISHKYLVTALNTSSHVSFLVRNRNVFLFISYTMEGKEKQGARQVRKREYEGSTDIDL